MSIAWAIAQQDESPYTISMKFYTRRWQLVCAGIAGFMALGVGSFMMTNASSYEEVKIPYTSNQTQVEFSIEDTFKSDVLVYYEMTGLSLNHKTFVESKDPLSIYKFMGAAQCDNADTKDWAQLRRGSDVDFMNRINAQPGNKLLPCGLVGLSTFTDSYTFQMYDDNQWKDITLDNSDITLTSGEEFSKIEEENGIYKIDGKQTWLTPDIWKQWQVWQRTAPGAHVVRNLWAIIPGGLKEGEYRVNFVENSPIWEEWQTSKTLVLANVGGFGNGGAVTALQFISFSAFAVEFVFLCTFVVMGMAKKQEEEQVHAGRV